MAFDDNQKYILAAGNQKEIYVISQHSYEHKDVLRNVFFFLFYIKLFKKGHKDSINCLHIEEKILFSGSDDLTIALWVF